MPTFEKYVASTELIDLQQELYLLEEEQRLLGMDHRFRIAEIKELIEKIQSESKDNASAEK